MNLDYLTADLQRIFHQNNLVTARRRVHEWQATRTPYTEERGGSSSPREITERLEDRAVTHQAARDAHTLQHILPLFRQALTTAGHQGKVTPELARLSEQLARIVTRYTQPVDHTTLEPDRPVECRSCARSGKIGTRHFPGHGGVPVWENIPKKGLCRWCYEHERAEGELPPLDVIDLYHRVGARSAGLELARRIKQRQDA